MSATAFISILRLGRCSVLRLTAAGFFTLFLASAPMAGTGTREPLRHAQLIQPLVEDSGTIIIRIVKEASGRILLSFLILSVAALLPLRHRIAMRSAVVRPLLTPLRLGFLSTRVTSSFL